MKFSINVQFDASLMHDSHPMIRHGSEQAQLAMDICGIAGTTHIHGDAAILVGDRLSAFAHLMSLMAAHEKITELRILHSIISTYHAYLAGIQVESRMNVQVRAIEYHNVVEPFEASLVIEAEVDGQSVMRRVRKIDLETSPNRDGDVIRRDEANMPKRRMRIRSNS